MNPSCRQFCKMASFDDEYRTRRTYKGAFEEGYKKCRVCNYYIKLNGPMCPCCGNRLATVPKNARARRRMTAEVHRY